MNLKETETPEFPAILPQLIEALDRVFPATLPRLLRSGEERIPSYDLRDIDLAVGQQQVITRLRVEMRRQQGRFKQ